MIDFAFYDNLIEFFDELWVLLNEDWKKFKIFVSENKKNLLWLFIALITLQFTDIMHFGNSCNKYYLKSNNQNGGANASVNSVDPVSNNSNPVKQKEALKKQKEGQIEAAKKQILSKKADKKAAKEAEAAKKKGPAHEGDSETKDVQKKLDFFNKLKGKVKASAGQHGLAGPVFSNLEGIFESVGGMFAILSTILIIFGVLSLPVLIFIIITYCIIKMLVGKLSLA